MCRMSSPRAATFVATSIGTWPERNCSSALSRAFWSRLPCSTATRGPAVCSRCPRVREELEQELELVLRVSLHHHVLDVGVGAVALLRHQHLRVREVLRLDLLHPGRERRRAAGRLAGW